MKTTPKNIAAFIVGFIMGGVVNMALVTAGPHVFPPPAGVNMADAKSLAASISLLEPKHFIFPFLAHATGTLVGAFLACFIAASYRAVLGYAIGVLTLAGGIAAAFMIPAPGWFLALDLVVAYIPMAWLGVKIARTVRK